MRSVGGHVVREIRVDARLHQLAGKHRRIPVRDGERCSEDVGRMQQRLAERIGAGATREIDAHPRIDAGAQLLGTSAPVACVIEMLGIAGMVGIVRSSPSAGAVVTGMLLTMITASAPAVSARNVLLLNEHPPRSMRAILPLKKPGGKASQPSVALPLPSLASSRSGL